jgi:hypothetical protein
MALNMDTRSFRRAEPRDTQRAYNDPEIKTSSQTVKGIRQKQKWKEIKGARETRRRFECSANQSNRKVRAAPTNIFPPPPTTT